MFLTAKDVQEYITRTNSKYYKRYSYKQGGFKPPCYKNI